MNSELRSIYADGVVTPAGYSHAMRVGDLVFVAGQVPIDESGAVVGAGDMAAQARQAFVNLAAVLEAAGSSIRHIAKLTYFVRDIGAVASIRAVRDEFIDVAAPPASTLVEVSRLFLPELLIEIEAVAVVADHA
jgi:reactive intermediate/imine deaminase